MYNLNAEQQAVIDSKAKRLLILAGAGTGKTATMISKIDHICNDEDTTGRSILALTFTNAAAFEMKNRFRKMHKGMASPEFRTFHSFCYNLLCHDKDVKSALGFRGIPVIADAGTEGRAKTQARLQVKCKLSDAQIEGKVKLSPMEEYELKIYNKALSRLLNASNTITFNLLSRLVTNLFISNHPSIDKYKKQYKYILVDEFQDTDPEQWEFVKTFENSNIFVIGDALQSIYAFRGADSEIIKSISNDSEWEVHRLIKNYRSSKNICDFANNMSIYADDSYRIEIESDKLGPKVVEIESCAVKYKMPVDDKCINHMIDELNSLGGTTAILSRTNAECTEVSKYLQDHNIEHFMNQGTDESLQFLDASIDTQYATDWLASYLNADQYANYIRLCEIHPEEESANILLKNFGNVPQIESRVLNINEIRRILKSKTPNIIKALYILKLVGHKSLAESLKMSDDIEGNIADIINYCKEKICTDSRSSIYVGTIHSSKGLEYDNVYLIGVNDISFRLDTKDDQNKNLYYVGITRAKTNLTVFFRKEPIPDAKPKRNRKFST